MGAGSLVQLRQGAGKAGLGHVTERTSLVPVYRQILVIQHQLTEQLDLLDLIVRRRSKPFDRPRLDAVDVRLELRNLLQRAGRERCAALLRAPRICAHDDGDDGRCNRQNRALCLAREGISKSHGILSVGTGILACDLQREPNPTPSRMRQPQRSFGPSRPKPAGEQVRVRLWGYDLAEATSSEIRTRNPNLNLKSCRQLHQTTTGFPDLATILPQQVTVKL